MFAEFERKGVPQMATKAEMYREMADHATENLTAQITDWVKFLLFAGKFYRYRSFLDNGAYSTRLAWVIGVLPKSNGWVHSGSRNHTFSPA